MGMTRIELNKKNTDWVLSSVKPKVEYNDFELCISMKTWFNVLSEKEKFIYLDLDINKINGGDYMILVPTNNNKVETKYMVNGLNLVVDMSSFIDLFWDYKPEIIYFRKHF
jgi:hypothetical protein